MTPAEQEDLMRRAAADPSVLPPLKLTPRRVAHGVVGIAKAVTGMGGASRELIEQRTAICAACPEAEMVGGKLRRCRICGCATAAKVRNASEFCPLPVPKWGPSPPP